MMHGEEQGITRRAWLEAMAALGAFGSVTAVLSAEPRQARAQGNLANLGPEENVDATLKRLFAGRPIKDGAAQMKLELPLIAENGAVVPVALEMSAPQTAESYVKTIYIISDRNRRPLNAKFSLTPAVGQAYVATNLRLGDSTDVRAVAEMSDGTLLQVKREVKVTVGGCGG